MITAVNAAFVLMGSISLLTACWAQARERDATAPAVMQNGAEYRVVDAAQAQGLLGRYPMARDAAGTAWQPDSTAVDGNWLAFGAWSAMLSDSENFADKYWHGIDFQQRNTQSLQMRRLIGRGTFGLRVGIRPDPWIARAGYRSTPMAGRAHEATSAIDRQTAGMQPVQLSASYSWPLTQHSSMFGYLGMPVQPALDATRFADLPAFTDSQDAPLREHWSDPARPGSEVVTVGYVWHKLKFERSSFRDRKQEDERLIRGSPRPFGVTSGRLSFNPIPNLALQISRGLRNRPDQIAPNDEIRRTTVSAIYNRSFQRNNWQTTLAFGRGSKMAAGSTSAYVLESVFKLANIHTYFGRFERASNDELFTESDTLYGQSFNANRFTLGYVYNFAAAGPAKLGIGALASKRFIPADQFALFGRDPASYKIFIRLLVHVQ